MQVDNLGQKYHLDIFLPFLKQSLKNQRYLTCKATVSPLISNNLSYFLYDGSCFQQPSRINYILVLLSPCKATQYDEEVKDI